MLQLLRACVPAWLPLTRLHPPRAGSTRWCAGGTCPLGMRPRGLGSPCESLPR